MKKKPMAPRRLPQPDQPMIDDGKGVLRFQSNPIVEEMVRASFTGRCLDLNDIARMNFTDEDRRHFAMLHGYSVSGALDLECFEGKKGDKYFHEAQKFVRKYQMTEQPKSK